MSSIISTGEDQLRWLNKQISVFDRQKSKKALSHLKRKRKFTQVALEALRYYQATKNPEINPALLLEVVLGQWAARRTIDDNLIDQCRYALEILR